MTPSNPTNGQPLIYRIMDALGVSHLVACINHTHEQSEVEGLTTALNSKAPINHSHDFIGEDTDVSYAGVTASEGAVHIEVRNQSGGGECDITPSNIGNLIRALFNPDTAPTLNSDNLVTSGGVKVALDNLTFDQLVSGQDEYIFLDGDEVLIQLGEGHRAHISPTNLPNLQRALTNPDNTPTAASVNLVTSGGVKAALPTFIDMSDSDHETLDISTLTPGVLYTVRYVRYGSESAYLNQIFTNGSSQKSIRFNCIDPTTHNPVLINQGDEFLVQIIYTADSPFFVTYFGLYE